MFKHQFLDKIVNVQTLIKTFSNSIFSEMSRTLKAFNSFFEKKNYFKQKQLKQMQFNKIHTMRFQCKLHMFESAEEYLLSWLKF